MKYFIILFLSISLLIAQGEDSNSTESSDLNSTVVEHSDEPVIMDDTSGLSDKEVRKIATDSDKAKKEKVSLKEVFEATDAQGKVDVSKLQSWEELSPTPKKYDWIQTKSGEWFKGEIKAMYDDRLEFDSDEVGLYTFKFKDITQIKSFHIISVNIEGVASFSGIIRYKDKDITIIQGDKEFKFPSSQVVSLAKDGTSERHFWSGKITVSLDRRLGNKDKFDYSAKANLKRRTDHTRLNFDYLGRMSITDDIETANDHRLNEQFDVYLSRKFFWTPIFSEFYRDKFQNINQQYTLGVGIGYSIIDTQRIEWDVSGGPAFVYTEYVNVRAGGEDKSSSPAIELNTKFDIELNKMIDFIYSYKFTYTDNASGRYKHHMVTTFENEITGWLDFDVTGVWDYILNPEEREDGTTPYQNDFQILLGFGVEF